MKFKRLVALGIAILAGGMVAGCGGAGNPGDDDPQSVDADIAEYEALQAELEAGRSVFVEGAAQDFKVAGNTLYWIDAGQGNPILKSYDNTSGNKLSYGFKPYLTLPSAPNPIDNLNFSVSAQLIGSMNEPDGANLYNTGAEDGPIAKVVLRAPPYGVRWWAYTVAGNDLYVALIVDDKYEVQKWAGGASPPTTVAVLDDLIAPNVLGEFRGLAVSDNTLIFNEQGRVWMTELGENTASWIQNEKQLQTVSFDASGAIYADGNDFIRYDRASDTRENVGDKIRAGYMMNATYAKAHHPNGGTWFGHQQKSIYYVGNQGLFRYDVASGTVEPLLLNARDNSTVYRTPTVLEDGTVFVKGLESSSGSVGADGPTFTL